GPLQVLTSQDAEPGFDPGLPALSVFECPQRAPRISYGGDERSAPRLQPSQHAAELPGLPTALLPVYVPSPTLLEQARRAVMPEAKGAVRARGAEAAPSDPEGQAAGR